MPAAPLGLRLPAFSPPGLNGRIANHLPVFARLTLKITVGVMCEALNLIVSAANGTGEFTLRARQFQASQVIFVGLPGLRGLFAVPLLKPIALSSHDDLGPWPE